MMRSHILLTVAFAALTTPLYASTNCGPSDQGGGRLGVEIEAHSVARLEGAQLSRIYWAAAGQQAGSTVGPQAGGTVTTKDQIDILLKEYDTLRADILLRSNVVFSILAVAAGILAWFIQRHRDTWFLPTFFAFVGIFIFIYWVNHQNIARSANRLKEIERKVNALAGVPEDSPLLEWETKWGGTAVGPFRQSPSSRVAMDPWLASLLVVLILCLASLVYKVIRPWFMAKSYRGVNLKGRWDWEFERAGSKFVFRAEIEQKAHKLGGSATVSKYVDGRSRYEETFRIVGSVHGVFVTLSLISGERKRAPFAVGLLRVSGGDEALAGHLLYRSATDEIRSEEVELKLCFIEPS